MQRAKALIKLHVWAGWSEPLLVGHTILLEISCRGSYMNQDLCLAKILWRDIEISVQLFHIAVSYSHAIVFCVFFYSLGLCQQFFSHVGHNTVPPVRLPQPLDPWSSIIPLCSSHRLLKVLFQAGNWLSSSSGFEKCAGASGRKCFWQATTKMPDPYQKVEKNANFCVMTMGSVLNFECHIHWIFNSPINAWYLKGWKIFLF